MLRVDAEIKSGLKIPPLVCLLLSGASGEVAPSRPTLTALGHVISRPSVRINQYTALKEQCHEINDIKLFSSNISRPPRPIIGSLEGFFAHL